MSAEKARGTVYSCIVLITRNSHVLGVSGVVVAARISRVEVGDVLH